jgi:carotenoid cleavage dioxygenase
VLLRAADIAGEPVAVLRMPQRVPFGLHGCWVPAG